MKPSVQTVLTKYIELSNSKSEILSASATIILESFASIKLEDLSAIGLINELDRVLHILMISYRKVVTNLTKIIGRDLVRAVNNAISNLEFQLKRHMKEFIASNGKIEIDYKPVMNAAQNFVDVVALKGDITISQSQLADPNVKDALIALSLVLDYSIAIVHSLTSSCEAFILEEEYEKPAVLHGIVKALTVFVNELTESIVNAVSNAVNIYVHFQTLTICASKLNATLVNVFKTAGPDTKRVTKEPLPNDKSIN